MVTDAARDMLTVTVLSGFPGAGETTSLDCLLDRVSVPASPGRTAATSAVGHGRPALVSA